MASRFDRDPRPAGPTVQGFAGRGFSVDGGVYEGLMLTPTSANGWDAPPLENLGLADLAPIVELDPPPEFIILGTGSKMAFPPRKLAADLDARGIAIEAMDSRAAARTWGMLRSEGRWITAALMPLD